MKQWVIFDAMGVVFEVGDDVGELLVPFIRERNKYILPGKINELYRQASLGEISSRTFWERLGLGELYPQIEKDYLDGRLTLDAQFEQVAKELGKTYNLTMLSNDIGEWSAYLRSKHDLNRYFKEVVISADVGQRKPSQQIFATLLARLGAVAGDCVFIDDNEKNLLGAQMLGIKTILLGAEKREMSEGARAKSLAELPALVRKILS